MKIQACLENVQGSPELTFVLEIAVSSVMMVYLPNFVPVMAITLL
jgi:hypothetical protein